MKLSTILFSSVIGISMMASAAQAAYSQNDESDVAEVTSEAPPSYINSTPEAYAAMQALPMDEPLQMLNLIRFKDKADYPEDSEFAAKGWSGEEAYAEYSRRSSPIATRIGGKPIYVGIPQLMLIGPQHETWDAAFIIEYPDLATFLSFVNDPIYKEHAFHRSAAIADSRLIRMTPPPE